MNFKYILFFLLILPITLQSFICLQTINGLSPIFTRQEIVDSPNDWNFWKSKSNYSPIELHNGNIIIIKNANKTSQCKKFNNEFISPDIDSVSYISDGKKLNATVWFTNNFTEPSTKDTVDIYQESLRITYQNLDISSKNLLKLASVTLARNINPLKVNNYNLLENNTVTIDGNKANELVYNENLDGLLLKNMTLFTIKNNRLYEITFSALNTTYNFFLSDVEPTLKSIQFLDSSRSNNVNIKNNQKKRF